MDCRNRNQISLSIYIILAQINVKFQNKEAMERAALLSHDFIAYSKKGNLEEIIATASENNIRLRKKLDLIKYEREKVRE